MATDEESQIPNVELEAITNAIYGNAFVGYFTAIPQCGENANHEQNLLTLKPYNVDRTNETIKGVTMPETTIPMIAIAFMGHQNAQYAGVGDGEFGMLSLNLKLDRYLNNYSAFLDWSFMKYDWSSGGQNSALGLKSQSDIEGIFVVEFINAEEKTTRKIGYSVIIENLPSLALNVDNAEEIIYDVTFKVTDIDIENFIKTNAISSNTKLV